MGYRVLVVEDQMDISSIVIKYLQNEGFDYALAKNGLDALEKFSHENFDLILLDVMMPGINGFEVLKEIRTHSEVPVIMLTAKEQEQDRIKGFDLGVDDYVVKPFSPRELMHRVKAVIKRVYGEASDSYLHAGTLKLNIKNMKLYKGEEEVSITSTEFKLLQTFMKNKGAILTRDQLIRLSFGVDYDGFDRNIDSHIKRLRQKIETDPKNPEYLVTKYGAGYVFGGEGL